MKDIKTDQGILIEIDINEEKGVVINNFGNIYVLNLSEIQVIDKRFAKVCYECNGTGGNYEGFCYHCNGIGEINE